MQWVGMEWLLPTVATAVATATATTFDDNIYLALFFSKTNRHFRPLHIVVGEFLGFSLLILISLSGFLLGRLCDSSWLGLLGLLPISIGVNSWLSQQGEERADSGMLTCDSASAPSSGRPRRLTLRRVFRDPRTYQVMAVSLANGGNNIAIYIPLFASCTLPRLAVIVSICYAAIALWCLNGWLLLRQPWVAVLMTRVVARLVPFLLISLGLSILLRNGTPQAMLALVNLG